MNTNIEKLKNLTENEIIEMNNIFTKLINKDDVSEEEIKKFSSLNYRQSNSLELAKSRQALELHLTELYKDKEDRFYAFLFFQIDRGIDNKNCPTMGVGIKNGNISLSVNGNFMDMLSQVKVRTILKHEALHCINGHLVRTKSGTDVLKHKMENIAMDTAINQYLDQTHIAECGSYNLDRFKKLLKSFDSNFIIEEKKEYEYYYNLLEQERDNREKNGDLEKFKVLLDQEGGDDHSGFGEMDALERAMLESKIRKAAEQTLASGAGKLPANVEELLAIGKNPKVDWKREIKQFIGFNTKSNTKRTRSKRNRRYGINVMGKKHDYEAKYLVVIDTSGSMYGSRTDKVLNELYGIWKINPSIGLDICECDTEIKDGVFTYNGTDKFEIKGRGGTDMAPALRYADECKYDGVIVLTDGEFYEDLTPCKTSSIWVVAENTNFTSKFGKTIHVD